MNLASVLALVAEVCLAIILFTAGAAKLLSPGRFRRTLELIPWVYPGPVRALSVAIPILEIAGGLLFFALPLVAAWLSVCLYSTFTVPVVWAIRTNQKLRCACFGELSATVLDRKKLWTLCLLIALAFVLAAFGHPINLRTLPALFLAESLAVTINLLLISAVGLLIAQRALAFLMTGRQL